MAAAKKSSAANSRPDVAGWVLRCFFNVFVITEFCVLGGA